MLKTIARDKQCPLRPQRNHHHFAFSLVDNAQGRVIYLIHFQVFNASCNTLSSAKLGFSRNNPSSAAA